MRPLGRTRGRCKNNDDDDDDDDTALGKIASEASDWTEMSQDKMAVAHESDNEPFGSIEAVYIMSNISMIPVW